MKQSRFDAGRLVQGVILFGFSVYLIKLMETGDIHRLVSPHIAVLLKITLGVLLVMTFYALATIFKKVETCEHDHHHDHHPRQRKGWVLLLAPIMLGLCVPTQSLG
ncbi:MAG: DUF1980 domain-containing protein, partial [Tumebacillaceae bacterium]